MEQLTFSVIDYVVFSSLLGISIIIGIYFGFFSKQDTVQEYIYAGKTMSYIPVAISGLSSLLSGITYLGFTTEVYLYGSQYAIEIVGAIIASIITTTLILPVFFKLQLLSVTEYLEMRFSKSVRKMCSISYILCSIVYCSIIIYAPAIAFSQLTGIELHLLTLVICTICIFYTSLGGVKAVVWTDTFQFVFTFVGFVSILFIGVIKVGGFSNIWKTSMEGGRMIIFNINPSIFERCTVFTVLSSVITMYVGSLGASQKHVQKLLTIHEEKEAKKAVWAITLGSVGIRMICIMVGLTMYTRYHGCDPLKTNKIKRTDELLPLFVMDVAGSIPGLPGIFLAGLISSGLATLSAALNTLGSMIYDDFLKVWLPEKYHEEKNAAFIMKIITVMIGILAIALVFVAEKMGTIFEITSTFMGIMGGPFLGLFVGGMLLPWMGKKGAFIGSYASLLIMAWIVGGTKWHVINGRIRYEPLATLTNTCPANETLLMNTKFLTPLSPEDKPWSIFRLSILHYSLLGSSIVIVVGLIVSYLADEIDLSKVDPDHISPAMRRFLPKEYLKVPLQVVRCDKKVTNDNDINTAIKK